MLEREHTSGQSHTLFSMRTRSSGNVLKEEGCVVATVPPRAGCEYCIACVGHTVRLVIVT